jgi:hypothetical protein
MKVVNCCVKAKGEGRAFAKEKRNPRQKVRGWRMLDACEQQEK